MFASPKRSALLSGTLHGVAILLILAVTNVKPQLIRQIHEALVVPLDLQHFKTTTLAAHTGGGGGGGRHELTPATLGDPPRFALRQFSLPTVKVENLAPVLPMEPTIIGNPDIQPVSLKYFTMGDPKGVRGPLSNGTGTGGGIGDGHGTGVGSGDGPGLGPGEGGGTGGEVGYLGSAMGSVSPPTLVTQTDPDYSEDARKARLQGTVLLRIEVNTSGRAQNVIVTQHLGLGLDERAVDAVKKWKFLPGKVNGKPAVVTAFVEVHFRLL